MTDTAKYFLEAIKVHDPETRVVECFFCYIGHPELSV